MNRYLIAAALVLATPAFAQSPPPLPASYTFTFTPEATDALYAALERASQLQVLVTGDRSPKFDALEAQIREGVQAQKMAVAKADADKAKAADAKPKDEPKKEAPKP